MIVQAEQREKGLTVDPRRLAYHVTFTTGAGLPSFSGLGNLGISPLLLSLVKAGFIGYLATRKDLPLWVRGVAAVTGLYFVRQGWIDSSLSGPRLAAVVSDVRGMSPCASCGDHP